MQIYLSLVQDRPANNFGIAILLTVVMAAGIGILIAFWGKYETFQFVNSNHNEYADKFFKYFTHYGDGVMWAALALFCFFFRKKYIIAVIAGAIISTIIAQFLKRVVFPDELRPIKFLAADFPIHQVEGVVMRQIHSFPSGHTVTAFTMALIMAYMINKKLWSFILPSLAFVAGYSRVYLAQHFPIDVFAGICIGMLSAILALLIYRYALKGAKIINTEI